MYNRHVLVPTQLYVMQSLCSSFACNLLQSPRNAFDFFQVVHMALQAANKASPCVTFTISSNYYLVNSSVILQKFIYCVQQLLQAISRKAAVYSRFDCWVEAQPAE